MLEERLTLGAYGGQRKARGGGDDHARAERRARHGLRGAYVEEGAGAPVAPWVFEAKAGAIAITGGDICVFGHAVQ